MVFLIFLEGFAGLDCFIVEAEQSHVDFPHGVITLSFDDNRKSQITKVLPLLQQRGMVATFFVVTDWIDYSNTNNIVLTVNDLAALNAAGNEITSHTASHPYLTELSDTEVIRELSTSKQALQSLGYQSNNFAYPFGYYDNRVENLVKNYYHSARGVHWLMYPVNLPVDDDDFTYLGLTGETGDSSALSNLKNAVDLIYNTPNGWGSIFFHDVVDGQNNVDYTISTEVFTTFLNYIVSKGIPTRTVEQIEDYVPTPSQYTLNILESTKGVTTPPAGTYTMDQGTIANVTALPNSGYVFSNWLLDGNYAGTSTTIHVTMNSDHTLNTAFSLGPSPNVSISPWSATLTVGQSKLFSANASGGGLPYTFQWYLNGSAVLNTNSSQWNFTPTQPGYYNVHVNVTDVNNRVAKSNTAIAAVCSQLNVTINPTFRKMYFGQSQTFTASISGGTTPYSYQWFLNDSAIVGATNSTWTFTPNANGNYKVYLNVTDSNNQKKQSNVVSDIDVCSVYLTLTLEPKQNQYSKEQIIHFTVNVLNQNNPALQSSLTFSVTGPGNTGYFDVQPTNVGADTTEEYKFNYIVPNEAGNYIVEVGLAPAQLTAYDIALLNVV